LKLIALALTCCVFVGKVAAFTFSDGTATTCSASGHQVTEVDGGSDSRVVKLNYTATTERGPGGAGYTITWNAAKLAILPPAVHDLIFFHECAHATLPTQDELRANCEGLRMMRAAGRAGAAVEAQLALFYGAANPYWVNTLKCANPTVAPAALPGAPAD